MATIQRIGKLVSTLPVKQIQKCREDRGERYMADSLSVILCGTLYSCADFFRNQDFPAIYSFVRHNTIELRQYVYSGRVPGCKTKYLFIVLSALKMTSMEACGVDPGHMHNICSRRYPWGGGGRAAPRFSHSGPNTLEAIQNWTHRDCTLYQYLCFDISDGYQ